MTGEIFRLLTPEEVKQGLRALEQCTYVDGRATASGRARNVKNNLEYSPEDTENDRLFIAAIHRHRGLQAFVMPSCFLPPLFSRYEPGMKYGDHVDCSIMGGSQSVRTDYAITLFLSPPGSYDGGELILESGEEIKLEAGEAFVYPATSIHHVAPVTRGIRLAAVTWMQSLIRDASLRAILYDLWKATQQVHGDEKQELALLLSKSYQNLIRYAVEPRCASERSVESGNSMPKSYD
jgi:PKHD-type hydroxylase